VPKPDKGGKNFNNKKQPFMKKTIMVLSCICLLHNAFAQKDEKVTMEKVKQECATLPLEQRARVSVTKFSVTTSATNNPATATVATPAPAPHGLAALMAMAAAARGGGGGAAPAPTQAPGYIPPAIGDNLTTMLTNALQGVNCYRVLESLKNNADLTGEIDAGSGAYAGKKGPKAGKQLGAQIVVTGEILEYSIKEKDSKMFGVGKNKKTVKIGFNLKMINPETRDVIASNVFRVESRTSKATSILGFDTNTDNDPAVAAVMEDGVVQAVEYMAKMRDSLHLTADGQFAGNSQGDGLNSTEITLSNANYTSFTAFAKLLSGLPEFKSVDKSLTNGVATFSVSHTGKSDALLDDLNKVIDPAKFEVTGFDAGKIDIKAK